MDRSHFWDILTFYLNIVYLRELDCIEIGYFLFPWDMTTFPLLKWFLCVFIFSDIVDLCMLDFYRLQIDCWSVLLFWTLQMALLQVWNLKFKDLLYIFHSNGVVFNQMIFLCQALNAYSVFNFHLPRNGFMPLMQPCSTELVWSKLKSGSGWEKWWNPVRQYPFTTLGTILMGWVFLFLTSFC